jgi:hypothetical protein
MGIRQILWRETDKSFIQANERFARVQAETAIKVETEDQSNDFTHEEPVTYHEPPLKPETLILTSRNGRKN